MEIRFAAFTRLGVCLCVRVMALLTVVLLVCFLVWKLCKTRWWTEELLDLRWWTLRQEDCGCPDGRQPPLLVGILCLSAGGGLSSARDHYSCPPRISRHLLLYNRTYQPHSSVRYTIVEKYCNILLLKNGKKRHFINTGTLRITTVLLNLCRCVSRSQDVCAAASTPCRE